MLKQRILTAAVMLFVFGGVLFLATTHVFSAFLGAVLVVAAWEWANLCHLENKSQRVAYAGFTAALGFTCWWALDQQLLAFLTVKSVLVIAAGWWAIALLWVQSYPASKVLWRSKWVRAVMGFLVLLPAWLGMTYLHSLLSGSFLVLAVVLVVATADTGAYFSGKAFGRRKLAPSVSPGKSWEGVFGGCIAVALLGTLFCLVGQRDDTLIVLCILLPTALVSVLGDLLESMLKRHRGIKDSSQLLPGHGGVLDRIDGLVAAVPIFTLAVYSSGWQW